MYRPILEGAAEPHREEVGEARGAGRGMREAGRGTRTLLDSTPLVSIAVSQNESPPWTPSRRSDLQ